MLTFEQLDQLPDDVLRQMTAAISLVLSRRQLRQDLAAVEKQLAVLKAQSTPLKWYDPSKLTTSQVEQFKLGNLSPMQVGTHAAGEIHPVGGCGMCAGNPRKG